MFMFGLILEYTLNKVFEELAVWILNSYLYFPKIIQHWRQH